MIFWTDQTIIFFLHRILLLLLTAERMRYVHFAVTNRNPAVVKPNGDNYDADVCAIYNAPVAKGGKIEVPCGRRGKFFLMFLKAGAFKQFLTVCEVMIFAGKTRLIDTYFIQKKRIGQDIKKCHYHKKRIGQDIKKCH